MSWFVGKFSVRLQSLTEQFTDKPTHSQSSRGLVNSLTVNV